MQILETPRMVLRHMELADVDNLLGIFSDPIAMRYYPGTKDRSETEGWIKWTLQRYEQHGIGLWVAILKDSGAFAGQCGLVVQEVEGKEEVEIGYLFLRKLWGQGLATEAASACRDYGFTQLGHTRLISLIDPHNMASRRVAEKVGMRLEQQVHKWDKPILVYAIERPQKTDEGSTR
jgi:ribosomal-protein-alanine N-acetyltransferase